MLSAIFWIAVGVVGHWAWRKYRDHVNPLLKQLRAEIEDLRDQLR